ncbi:MAG: MerR family transcriptional regulator [Clostridium sp.]
MKLQDVLTATGLGKKAIYFYIKEKLIDPSKNIQNGYYDFSEQDMQRLKVIVNLRKMGMPISDIKEVFQYPTMTNYFIHRQINNIKNNIYEQVNQLKVSYDMIEGLAINAQPKELIFSADKVFKNNINAETLIEYHFPSSDCRLVAILLLAPFTNIEFSDYNNFLWDKITNELKIQLQSNLINLKKLIYSLTPEQIKEVTVKQFSIFQEITDAKEEDLYKYEDMYYKECLEICENVYLQERWKHIYKPVIIPAISFFRGDVNKFISQSNPKYKQYCKNIDIIASNLLNRLIEDKEVLDKLFKVLDYKLDIKDYKYAELMCLCSFKNSMYSKFQLEYMKNSF